MAAKTRRGRGAEGAKHEVAVLVRFTSEHDAVIREAIAWTGSQLAQFIREAAVLRAREVLQAKAAGALPMPAAPPKGRPRG